jgi:hypothetical protein
MVTGEPHVLTDQWGRLHGRHGGLEEGFGSLEKGRGGGMAGNGMSKRGKITRKFVCPRRNLFLD